MNAVTMADVIVPKSDQWNADDFIAGPRTFTIREVQIRGGQEQPVNILLEGSDKAFRPCKSMSRVLVHAWGPDAKLYVGRSLTLYRDPTVKWGGLEVGGIRISHLSHIDGKMQMQLTATKGQRKPFVVMPLVVQRPTTDASRAKAEKWLSEYLANPTDGPVTQRALVRLESEFPDLYAQTQRPPMGDDPFDIPPSAAASNDARQPDVAATGGVDPSRATADRLIALARDGEAFAEADVAAFHNLPPALRSEVDAASETA
jgi:hypothetical protein